MAQRHSVDDYLETIWFLAFPIGEYRPLTGGTPTLASRVAEMLGVSRASAGEMLKRLEAEGLVHRGEHKEALLTKAGRARAERVVRRHRIIERLLTDFMGYTAAEAHVHADELGDTFSDEMIERIEAKLGHPERCPHGWPVNTDVEQAENRELAPLSALAAGDRATVVRLAEHDGELLHWYYDQGLVPGVELEVEDAQPAAGQLTVRLDGGERAVGEKAAAGLFVRRADQKLGAAHVEGRGESRSA
jgi:DtxR family Mn-dependent transcriptional regulator